MICKRCNSEELIKNGKNNRGEQRYICKSCRRIQIEGDKRIKFTKEQRYQALVLYTEGNGFRRIARILTAFYKKKFANNTILHWIRKFGKETEGNLLNIKQKIGILEMDELHTFVKKTK